MLLSTSLLIKLKKHVTSFQWWNISYAPGLVTHCNASHPSLSRFLCPSSRSFVSIYLLKTAQTHAIIILSSKTCCTRPMYGVNGSVEFHSKYVCFHILRKPFHYVPYAAWVWLTFTQGNKFSLVTTCTIQSKFVKRRLFCTSPKVSALWPGVFFIATSSPLSHLRRKTKKNPAHLKEHLSRNCRGPLRFDRKRNDLNANDSKC